MRLALLAALAAAGCWADFPPELLRPDRGTDAPVDLVADRPADRPAERGRDAAVDARGDARRDAAVDARGDARQDAASEARVDLAATDAAPDARVLLPLGSPCTSAAQCASNHCDPRSKLCCNTACAGTCQSCALAGLEGRCSFVPAGADPLGDCPASALASCGLDGTCDGKGACRNYPAGTQVSAAACAGAKLEKVALATVCDGAGTPKPGAELLCDPYTCDPGTGRCRSSCASAGECATGTCQAQKCNAKARPLGATCTKNADCASVACVDGVCCENSCGGPCRRCNLAGLEGTCTPAHAGTDPDGECSASGAPCGGLDGQCDGAGACRAWLDGTPCASASCTASELTLFGTCKAGACAKVTASCGNYGCLPAGDGCYAFCAKDEHCKPGCTCNTASWSCEGSC